MSFSWGDYCDLAHCLCIGKLRGSRLEARLRSAVSRAYYSAYCSARNYMLPKYNKPLPLGKEHEEVRDWFRAQKDQESQQIYNVLATLAQKRTQADYDEVPRNLDVKKDAVLSVLMAQQVLTALSTMK